MNAETAETAKISSYQLSAKRSSNTTKLCELCVLCVYPRGTQALYFSTRSKNSFCNCNVFVSPLTVRSALISD